MSAVTLVSLRPNISLIYCTSAFERQVQADLDLIETTEIGRRLIAKIGAVSNQVFIKSSDRNYCSVHNTALAQSRFFGSPCTINYTGRIGDYLTLKLRKVRYRSFMILAHELIHAYHAVYGKFRPTDLAIDNMVWLNSEEYYTIMGRPSNNPHRIKPKICENAFLEEFGAPKRFSHFTQKSLLSYPANYHRVVLSAALFRQRSRTFTPLEQLCPPIVQLTADLFESCSRLIRVYVTKDHRLIATQLARGAYDPFISMEIPRELWAELYTPLPLAEIQSITEHRLTPSEAAAHDRGLRKRKR